MSERIVALDVETATATRESMCSLGIAVFQDGYMTEQRYWMVQPPNNVYDTANIRIHGITPDQTASERHFPGVWPELRPYLDGCDFIIAHNAGFDMTVLRASLGCYGLPIPDYTYGCTYVLSNRILGRAGKGERRLNALCERYGVPLYHHHDASEDSVACGKMVYRLIKDEAAALAEAGMPAGGWASVGDAFRKQDLFKSLYRDGEAAWDESRIIYLEGDD